MFGCICRSERARAGHEVHEHRHGHRDGPWAERYITDALIVARPHDAIVGEEGTRRDGSSGVHWYVDPIDGTTNYPTGIRATLFSIGASVDGELRLLPAVTRHGAKYFALVAMVVPSATDVAIAASTSVITG